MIGHIGLITGKKESAKNIISEIHEKFNQVKSPRQYRVAYLIWKNPYMSVGKDTFIHSILHKAGFINVFDNHIRYPEISEDMLLDCCADFVFLSSEPYPFKKKHITEIKAILSKKNPNTKVLLVDGESFSWYGSRLLTSADYLNDLINSL
jgi:ABC-type Fe3+-hydroxamate transport system substrate-binding protein